MEEETFRSSSEQIGLSLRAYLETIDILRKENSELNAQLQSSKLKLQAIEANHNHLKESYFLKIGLLEQKILERFPSHYEEWLQDVEVARVQARLNQETLRHYDRTLSEHKQRIQELESQLRHLGADTAEVQPFDFPRLLSLAKTNYENATKHLENSEATLKQLSEKLGGSDLLEERPKEVRNTRAFTPNQFYQKSLEYLEATKANTDLLLKYENQKTEFVQKLELSSLHKQLEKTLQLSQGFLSVFTQTKNVPQQTVHKAQTLNQQRLQLTHNNSLESLKDKLGLLRELETIKNQVLANSNTAPQLVSLEEIVQQLDTCLYYSENTLAKLCDLTDQEKSTYQDLRNQRVQSGQLTGSSYIKAMHKLLLEHQTLKDSLCERFYEDYKSKKQTSSFLQTELFNLENSLSTLSVLCGEPSNSFLEEIQSVADVTDQVEVLKKQAELMNSYTQKLPNLLSFCGVFKDLAANLLELTNQTSELKNKLEPKGLPQSIEKLQEELSSIQRDPPFSTQALQSSLETFSEVASSVARMQEVFLGEVPSVGTLRSELGYLDKLLQESNNTVEVLKQNFNGPQAVLKDPHLEAFESDLEGPFSVKWKTMLEYIKAACEKGLVLEDLKKELVNSSGITKDFQVILESIHNNTKAICKQTLPNESFSLLFEEPQAFKKNLSNVVKAQKEFSRLMNKAIEGEEEELLHGELKAQVSEILNSGEELLVEAYQKLMMHNASVKAKLENILEDKKQVKGTRKELACLKAQLEMLREMLSEANDLTEVIEGLKEIESSQIELQQFSKSNYETMKTLLKNSLRSLKKKDTYLKIDYAVPSNPSEGLDVLKVLIEDLKNNQSILHDVETSKNKLLSNSDLGQSAEAFLKDFSSDKSLLQKIFSILLNLEVNQDHLSNCEKLLETQEPETLEFSQASAIKETVNLAVDYIPKKQTELEMILKLLENLDQDHSSYMKYSEKLEFDIAELKTEFETVSKNLNSKAQEANHNEALLSKLQKENKQASETLQKTNQEVSEICKQLGEALVKCDFVGDTLIAIAPDSQLKQKEDLIQEKFEEVIQNMGEGSTATAKTLLDLLCQYEEANLVQSHRLEGRETQEIDQTVEKVSKISKSKPSAAKARKVRSEKPVESPNAKIDKACNSLLKDVCKVLTEFTSEDPLIEKAGQLVKETHPSVVQAIFAKQKLLHLIAERVHKEIVTSKQAQQNKLSEFIEAIQNETQATLSTVSKLGGAQNELIESIRTQVSQVLKGESSTSLVSVKETQNQLLQNLVSSQSSQELLNQLKQSTCEYLPLVEELAGACGKLFNLQTSIVTQEELQELTTQETTQESLLNFYLCFATKLSQFDRAIINKLKKLPSRVFALESKRHAIVLSQLEQEESEEVMSDMRSLQPQESDPLSRLLIKARQSISYYRKAAKLGSRSSSSSESSESSEEFKELTGFDYTVPEKSAKHWSGVLNNSIQELRQSFQKEQSNLLELCNLEVKYEAFSNKVTNLDEFTETLHGETESWLSAKLQQNLALRSKLKQLEDQINPLVKYRKMYSHMKSETEYLQKENSKLTLELNQQTSKVKELTHENEQLKYASRTIEKYQREKLSLENENQRLLKKLEIYQESSGSSQLQSVVDKLNQELQDRLSELQSYSSTCENLKQQLLHEKESKSVSLKRQVLLRLMQLKRMECSVCLSRWKSFIEETNEEKEDSVVIEIHTEIPKPWSSLEFVGNFENSIAEQAQKLLLEERTSLLNSNPIIKAYRTGAVSCENFMDKERVVHLFEDMLESKYELDLKYLETQRMPKRLCEYLLEYLLHLYGNKKVMMKYLSEFVPGLHKLYEEQDSYGLVICKLLNLYHSCPCSAEEGSFLVKMNFEFNRIAKEDLAPLAPTLKLIHSVFEEQESKAAESELDSEVSKDKFLTGLLKGISCAKEKNLCRVVSLYKEYGNQPLNFEAFKRLLKSMVPGRSIEDLYDLGLLWSSDPQEGVTLDSLYKLLLKEKLGVFQTPLYTLKFERQRSRIIRKK